VLRDAGEADDEVYLVGIRESTDPQAWSLLFMECKAEDEEEQEVDLAWTPTASLSTPARPPITAVSASVRSPAELRLVLTEDAASTLEMPRHTRFVVDLSPDKRDMLGRGSRRVLTSGRADALPQLRFV
jgi:hypothetical protein